MPYSDPWIYTEEDVLQEYYPLEKSKDLDPLMERIGNANYVLLGEASHGTHEYYTWRTAISKRLIEEKGFSFIAVEGDWPDCYRINRYVKNYPDAGKSAKEVVEQFHRWPTWMWANWEVVALMEWMKEYNATNKKRVGFYGLDVYSLWESMDAIITYLRKEDPAAAAYAEEAFRCFEPYKNEGKKYAQATYQMSARCTEEVISLLSEIRKKSIQYNSDPEAALNTSMNAQVIANAEQYYRSMISFEDRSWNIRDDHMVTALNALMKFHGTKAKVIVWEHNTHIGDARATDMHADGLWNVGQLVREQHDAEGVVLVGFGSYEGSVIAGRKWGAPMEEMDVPPAKRKSIENILHNDSAENKILILNKEKLKKRFREWIGHRAIGVVYHPEREAGNYVPTVLPSRYDAFLFIDKTKALHPIKTGIYADKIPDTYPFGF